MSTAHSRRPAGSGGSAPPGGPAPEVTLERPRLSVWHVLNRVRIRLLDIQVWDVAGTMTFYTVLSVFPAAVAMVSMVSMLGLRQETVDAFTGLVTEIFPSLNLRPYQMTIFQIASTGGNNVLWLTLGLLGALLAASNGVAAFHRAMHRVFDTREGRPFLWFRTIVFFETLILISVVLLAIGMVVLGGEASQSLGELVGIPRIAFEAWNLVKWPILLVILIIGVSLAYYLFPNVRLPRYRVMTLGSTISVLVLFGSALVVGRLAGYATRFSEVLTALNGLIGILLLIWLANIVIVAGAALDAEFLRARQIALGMPAWNHIELEPQATHSLDFLSQDADRTEEVGRIVAEAARTGAPVQQPRSWWVVDARNPFSINPPKHAQVELRSPPDDDAPPAPPMSSAAPASPASPA